MLLLLLFELVENWLVLLLDSKQHHSKNMSVEIVAAQAVYVRILF